MNLKELVQEIKKVTPYDDELRVYLYENRIEFYDFSYGYEAQGETYKDSMSLILALNIKDNVIKTIENQFGSFITPANSETILLLCNLIGEEIVDYGTYEKLQNLIDLPHLD